MDSWLTRKILQQNLRNFSKIVIFYRKKIDKISVYLTEFGNSIELDSKYFEELSNTTGGTAGYICPEILKNPFTNSTKDCQYFKIDMFSIGVVLYEMLKRVNPFKNPSLTENNNELNICYDNIKINNQQLEFLKELLTHYPENRLSAEKALCHSSLQQNLTGCIIEKGDPDRYKMNLISPENDPISDRLIRSIKLSTIFEESISILTQKKDSLGEHQFHHFKRKNSGDRFEIVPVELASELPICMDSPIFMDSPNSPYRKFNKSKTNTINDVSDSGEYGNKKTPVSLKRKSTLNEKSQETLFDVLP